MDISVLDVRRRETLGSSASRRLRREGMVPAVLYGHREEVISLTVAEEDARGAIEAGHRMVSLKLEGAEQRALIRDVQYDTFGLAVLHMDFTRVAVDERVAVVVALEMHGAPKDVANGAVLEQPMAEIEVECRADSIPSVVRVEVGHLEIGKMVHVADVALPEGVKSLVDPQGVVAVLHPPKAEEEEEEAAPEEAESAEPEVIGRDEKAEGEEAE